MSKVWYYTCFFCLIFLSEHLSFLQPSQCKTNHNQKYVGHCDSILDQDYFTWCDNHSRTLHLLHNCWAEVQMSCVSIASFRLEGRIWPHDWSSCRQHASKHTEYYYILCQAVYFVHVTAFLLNFSHTMLTSEFRALAIVGIVTLDYYVRFTHWLRNHLTSISLICSSAEYVLHICCQHGLWQRWANVTLL